MTYKIRVTTTVEQLDFDGRVLFSVTDTTDTSSITPQHEADNEVSEPYAFARAAVTLNSRIFDVLVERYERAKR